jgi:hypothetical protein
MPRGNVLCIYRVEEVYYVFCTLPSFNEGDKYLDNGEGAP